MSQETVGTVGMECWMPAGAYLLSDPEWVAQGHEFLPAAVQTPCSAGRCV